MDSAMTLTLNSTNPMDRTSQQLPSTELFAGRYRVLRSLKKANGVETLLALDLSRDQRVVIKTAADEALSTGAQMRLEHEAEVLRQIQCPWVAPLLHWGREEQQLFLVIPFLPGITLED